MKKKQLQKVPLKLQNSLKFALIVFALYIPVVNIDKDTKFIYDLKKINYQKIEKRTKFGSRPLFQNLCWNFKNCYIGEDKIISNNANENSLNLLILFEVLDFGYVKSSLKIFVEEMNSVGYLCKYLSSQFASERILNPSFLKLIRSFFSSLVNKLISSNIKPYLLLLMLISSFKLLIFIDLKYPYFFNLYDS